jgi:hypothetical protein
LLHPKKKRTPRYLQSGIARGKFTLRLIILGGAEKPLSYFLTPTLEVQS